MNYKKRIEVFKNETMLLKDHDKDLINDLVEKYYHNINIISNEKKKILCDLMNIISYYYHVGMKTDEIISLLSVKNIGKFYNLKYRKCYALDNLAKIFPLSMNYNNISIFRVSVYLIEDVKPVVLQMALNYTIKRFPHFATRIKSGFYWHYLEQSKVHYNIYEDTYMPCQTMKLSKYNSHAFRVKFYKKRISLEFFHILTDGTGGLIFLKTLTNEYLRLLGNKVEYDNGTLDINSKPLTSEIINEYSHAEKNTVKAGFDPFAVQLKGKLHYIRPCKVVHLEIKTNDLKRLANAYNTKITPIVLAILFIASKKAINRKRGVISIQLPVNMRNYKETKTLRNFALYCTIKYPADGKYDYETLIESIDEQMKKGLIKENLNHQMILTNRLVKALKLIPLFLKRAIIRVSYLFFGEFSFTTTLSNLGKVDVNGKLSNHVDKFDFILGTTSVNKSACSMIGYKDTTVLTISKNTLDPTFEKAIINELKKNKIDFDVTGGSV